MQATIGGIDPSSQLKDDLLQIGVRREPARRVARIDEFLVDYDVELARLALSHLYRPTPASFNPSLHTEGFGFVASTGAVMNQDRHVRFLVGGTFRRQRR